MTKKQIEKSFLEVSEGSDVYNVSLNKPKRIQDIRMENCFPDIVRLEIQLDKSSSVIVRAVPKKNEINAVDCNTCINKDAHCHHCVNGNKYIGVIKNGKL